MSVDERIPPHDETAEIAALGCTLCDAWACDIVFEELRQDDFYAAKHQIAYRALSMYVEEHGSPVDPVELKNFVEEKGLATQLNGSFWGQLIEMTPTPVNVERYCRIVRELSEKRRLLSATHTIQKLIFVPDDDPTPICERSLGLVEGCYRETEDARPLDLQAVANRIIDDTLAGAPRAVWGMPTGLANGAVDAVTGGVHRGEFWALAGCPGMGKSTFINALCRGVHTENPNAGEPLILSTEMTPEAMALFAIGATSGTHTQGLLRRDLTEPQRLAVEAVKTQEKLKGIKVMFVGGKSISAVRMIARAHERHNGLPLMIVDMASGLHAEGKNENERMSKIIHGLRDLKGELNCCVVACAHLNREVHKDNPSHKPQMWHLRDSGEWEQCADRIIFLHREGYYGKDDDRTEIIQKKDRNSGLGEQNCFVVWHKHSGLYTEAGDPTQPQEQPEDEQRDIFGPLGPTTGG